MTQEKLQYVNPRDLIASSNVRPTFAEQPMLGLMASLQEVGMLQPIRVQLEGGRLIILDGARRCTAAVKLNWDKVPVLVDSKPLSDSETIHRQLIANCQHENLTAGEQAVGMRSLMELTQWSSTEAAKRLGMSTATVTKTLSLLALPKHILEKVNQGSIPASCAYELTRVEDPVQQSQWAECICTGQLTRDGLIRAIRGSKPKPEIKTKEKPTCRATASLDDKRSITVSGPGLDMSNFIIWLEELLVKARRERTRGVELGTFVKVLRDQSRVANEPQLR